MIPEIDIDHLLNRIEQSASFGNSSTYKRLLRFLVDSSLKDAVPNEYDISEYLLGKNQDTSDNSKIRVYVYHLRKKLKKYFEEEGADEAYILSIPKGAYKVEFSEASTQKKGSKKNNKNKYIFSALALLLAISLIGNFFLFKKKSITRDSALSNSSYWKPYFEKNIPIQIYVGDLFIFSATDPITGETGNMRMAEINSDAQFEDYRNLDKNAARKLERISYTHLPKSSAEWVSHLTKVFHPEQDFIIKTASLMKAEDLHNYNLIYVGMQKTAGLFNGYFDDSVFDFDPSEPNQYKLLRGDSLITYAPEGTPEEKHRDYGFIAKYPGPNDNTIFLFCGLWDSATSEAVRLFSSEQNIKEVEQVMIKELGKVPEYFEMLIEVNGLDRIGFESKILIVNELTPN